MNHRSITNLLCCLILIKCDSSTCYIHNDIGSHSCEHWLNHDLHQFFVYVASIEDCKVAYWFVLLCRIKLGQDNVITTCNKFLISSWIRYITHLWVRLVSHAGHTSAVEKWWFAQSMQKMSKEREQLVNRIDAVKVDCLCTWTRGDTSLCRASQHLSCSYLAVIHLTRTSCERGFRQSITLQQMSPSVSMWRVVYGKEKENKGSPKTAHHKLLTACTCVCVCVRSLAFASLSLSTPCSGL